MPEMLKEEHPIVQIASQYVIHPNQLYKGKTQELKELRGLFEDVHKSEKDLKAAHKQQVE